jgi:hypothetical protein
MHPTDLPLWMSALGSWAILGLKIAGAIGFVAAADVLVLYAC